MKSDTNARRAIFSIRCVTANALLALAAFAGAFAQPGAFARGVVIVVYRQGIAASHGAIAMTPAQLLDLQSREAHGTLSDEEVPRYTADLRTNRALLAAGVLRSQRLFGSARFPVGDTFRLTVFRQSVQTAIARLRAVPGVASAAPDWYVSPMAH